MFDNELICPIDGESDKNENLVDSGQQKGRLNYLLFTILSVTFIIHFLLPIVINKCYTLYCK